MQINRIFCILLILLVERAAAQSSMTDLLNKKIDMHEILGFWESNDTMKAAIEFLDNGQAVVLLPKTHITPYAFQRDSSVRISALGAVANWPPYYCGLNLSKPDLLDITYFDVAYAKPHTIQFRRKKK